MAEQRKISELTEVTTLNDDDELVFVKYGDGNPGPEPTPSPSPTPSPLPTPSPAPIGDDYIQLQFTSINNVELYAESVPSSATGEFFIDWGDEVVTYNFATDRNIEKTWSESTTSGRTITLWGDIKWCRVGMLPHEDYLTSAVISGMSSITNTGLMFDGCKNLTSVDLTNFDTSNVTIMDNMFLKCENLTELDLSNFNTSNVTRMSMMFGHCEELTNIIGIADWDVSNVNVMEKMFEGCDVLTEIDLSNWCVSQFESMPQHFVTPQYGNPFYNTESKRPKWGVECD